MDEPSFKDHFSSQARDYARFRPAYPAELFAWLAHLAPSRVRAWDCGTGSGQAALALTAHFAHVIASDPSARQLEQAPPHERITYRNARAEVSGLETASIDLITVAQALHWFDLAAFYAEARRVLKPGGILAAWTYTLLDVEAGIGTHLATFYRTVIGPFWPPERSMVDDGYRSLEFPFAPIDPPPFAIQTRWTREQFLGYLGTWSAVQAYRRERGEDPLIEFARQIAPLWPAVDETRHLRWPLQLRVGRVPG